MHPRQGPAYVTPTSMTDIWAREDKAGLNSHTLGLLQVRFGHRETAQCSLVDGRLTGRLSCTAFFALAHTPLLSMNHSGHCRQISNHLSPFILLRYVCYRAAILESVKLSETFSKGYFECLYLLSHTDTLVPQTNC